MARATGTSSPTLSFDTGNPVVQGDIQNGIAACANQRLFGAIRLYEGNVNHEAGSYLKRCSHYAPTTAKIPGCPHNKRIH
jgi:hypothetical protein